MERGILSQESGLEKAIHSVKPQDNIKPMKKNKWLSKIGAVALAGLTLINGYSKSEACTGARQITMGGAGITICDDSHAVYWNQAMLPFLKNNEVSYTRLNDPEENHRYDNVGTVALKLNDRIGIGMQYIESDQLISKSQFVKEGDTILGTDTGEGMHTSKYTVDHAKIEHQEWVKLAIGVKVYDGEKWKIGLGCAVTPKKTIRKVERIYNLFDKSKIIRTFNTGNTIKSNSTDYEISFLAERKDAFRDGDLFRMGALVRDYAKLWSAKKKRRQNIRPGLSYKCPNGLGELTLATSYYNLFPESGEKTGARFGVEQTFSNLSSNLLLKNLAVRAGHDGHNGMETVIGGIGYKGKKFDFDFFVGGPNGESMFEFSLKF